MQLIKIHALTSLVESDPHPSNNNLIINHYCKDKNNLLSCLQIFGHTRFVANEALEFIMTV